MTEVDRMAVLARERGCECALRADGSVSAVGACGCPIHGMVALRRERDDARQQLRGAVSIDDVAQWLDENYGTPDADRFLREFAPDRLRREGVDRMADIAHADERTLWSCMACGAVGDRQSCHACGAEAMPGAWVPADAYRGAVDRPDYEQVVTDILVGLDGWLDGKLDLNDGPDVDDARDAVMRELVSYFGGQS